MKQGQTADAPPSGDGRLDELEAALGYTFVDRRLLREAVTHSSFVNEHAEAGPHNERLEFVGDAVLGLVAARVLYDRVAEREGELSRRRARVVRTESLAALAESLELGRYLHLGEGQRRSFAKEGKRLLENAFEALAGAVFLDGGFPAAEACFGPRLAAVIEQAVANVDWKSELQELCHARGLLAPRYSIVRTEGPDHARVFTCQVEVGEGGKSLGQGTSKKAAEQECARAALDRMVTR